MTIKERMLRLEGHVDKSLDKILLQFERFKKEIRGDLQPLRDHVMREQIIKEIESKKTTFGIPSEIWPIIKLALLVAAAVIGVRQ